MPRVLLFATTTGYQTRAFGAAAERLGVELVFATDRCHLIEDPWQDDAIPIRFYDEPGSVAAILESAANRPVDGLLVVGDRPTVIAARVAERLGIPWHSPDAAAAARHKLLTRECLRAAGLPVPWFIPVPIDGEPSRVGLLADPAGGAATVSHQPVRYPCVLKPVALSGSRGVMRADDPQELAAVFGRLQALMNQPDVRAERDDAHATALIEEFIPGREYALEGIVHRGRLQTLAIFDKPDPLDGPFFEETIYLTPSSASAAIRQAIVAAAARAARALGLGHGPIHAECRVDPSAGPGQAPQVFVLEVAARPIGGLCARALRFQPASANRARILDKSAISELQSTISLEELLLRHALGEDPAPYEREDAASGVMMIPIPKRGIFRRIDGIEAARGVDGIDEIHITAKADQLLLPLPEGASYLGFIFARGGNPDAVDRALRAAHARLVFTIDPQWPVLVPGEIHYNRQHG
jgi:carbamoylphosphate synthase large subunit